jgi:mannosyl-oligosaccharide alpha-1,2-mannosidase
MVDALDTLWIMGLHNEFYATAAAVVRLDWANTTYTSVKVFETTIRYLGGLISAYDLSGRPALLQKATELGDMLYMAFDTPNRIPPFMLDFADARDGTQVAGDSESAAAPTSLTLEFTRLAQLTGDARYFDAADRVVQFLVRTQNETLLPGLWPSMIDFQSGDAGIDGHFSLGADCDSLYEYLPKMYALLGGLDGVYETLYRRAMDVAVQNLLFRPMLPDGEDVLFAGEASVYAGDLDQLPQGQHLACFAGGMFGLGGKLFGIDDHVSIGNRLARGCAWAYRAFPTGVMPEKFAMIACDSLNGLCPWDESRWESEGDEILPKGFSGAEDPRYLLRPEAIESVFLLYRMTGDEDLQDIAWQMFESVVKATETEYANSEIEDVTATGETEKWDSMEVSKQPKAIILFRHVLANPQC